MIALSAGVAAASVEKGKVPVPIVFPVVGNASYTNDFGDPRSQGQHEGNDILAPKRSVAVAAEAGTIKLHTTSARAGCMLYLHGASGTTYLYIHLNNDLTDGPDNKGKCVPGVAYAPGVKDGQQVEAGQPLGFVGDSGDAEGTSHLHFEIHPGDGGAVNPYPHLIRATRLLFSAVQGSTITLSLSGSIVSSSAGLLQLKVDSAQVLPLGLVLSKLKKPLRLTLPPTALIDTGRGQPGLAAQVSSSLAGRSVFVLTEPAAATLATQTGADGAYSAARIVFRP